MAATSLWGNPDWVMCIVCTPCGATMTSAPERSMYAVALPSRLAKIAFGANTSKSATPMPATPATVCPRLASSWRRASGTLPVSGTLVIC
jgi:hypothetical protein